MNIKTLIVMVVAFCAFAAYSMPKISQGMFKSDRNQSYDLIEEAIEGDPNLNRVRFSTFARKTLSGVADSPESLKQLRTVFDQARKLNPDLEFKVILYPGYTPYFISGKVVYENGQPAEDVWVQVVCSEISLPEGQKNVEFLHPKSMGRYSLHTQKGGLFEQYHLPTTANATLALTVLHSRPGKIELVVPVNTKNITITIPNKR